MITIIEYLNSKKSLHAFYKDIGEQGPLFDTDIVYDNYDTNSYCIDKHIKVTNHITSHIHLDGYTLQGTTIWNP